MNADMAKKKPNDNLKAGSRSSAERTFEFPILCLSLSCCTMSIPYLDATCVKTTATPPSKTRVLLNTLSSNPARNPAILPWDNWLTKSGSRPPCLPLRPPLEKARSWPWAAGAAAKASKWYFVRVKGEAADVAPRASVSAAPVEVTRRSVAVVVVAEEEEEEEEEEE